MLFSEQLAWGNTRIHCNCRCLQVLGDAKGKVTYGVTSAFEANGRLFLGSIRRNGVPVLDLKDIQ
jgi:hypothetical protein